MEKERVVRYIIILLIIAVLTAIGYAKIRELLPLWNPLLDEEFRLVRYYACSLAICTRGCGDPIITNKDCSKGDCMCLERDPGNRECLKWCEDVCKENKWSDGKGIYCNESYYINLTLKSPVRLKGCYKREKVKPVFAIRLPALGRFISSLIPTGRSIIVPFFDFDETCHTKVDDILKILGETENFTWNIIDNRCIKSTFEFGWLGLYKVFIEIGAIDEEGAPKYNAGWIFVRPLESHEKYNCFKGAIGCPGISRLFLPCSGCPGFYECTFKGNLKIFAFKKPDVQQDCADVIIGDVDKPFTGGFDLWIEPNEILIQIGQKANFEAFIKNNLGFDSSFTFKLKYPEEANCKFIEDEDKVSVYVEKNSQGSKIFTCEPTKTGSYEIEVVAWDGAIVHSASASLKVGDFSIDIKPDTYGTDREKIYAGRTYPYDISISNTLGKDAVFTLSLSAANEMNCILETTSLFVENNKVEKTSYSCTPAKEAAGNYYTVTVSATNDTLTRTDTANFQVSACVLGTLSLSLSSDKSGESSEIKVTGFQGCPNRNAKFNVSLVTDDGEAVGEWSIGEKTTSDDSVSITKTLGSPGNYIFKAYIDFDKDGSYESYVSTTATINPGNPDEKRCRMCKNEKDKDTWCAFSLGTVVCSLGPISWSGADICDHAGCWFWSPATDCTYACDPQSCYQDPKKGVCASASNLCCVHGMDYYSPGPPDVPCLSPDTNTHNLPTKNFTWRYKIKYVGLLKRPIRTDYVINARNVLVDDNVVEISCNGDGSCAPVYERGSFATFKWDVFCRKNKDCSSPYFETECVDIPDDRHPSRFKGKKACKIKGSDNDYWFTSWLYINVSPTGRPVYGVKIHARGDPSQYKTRNWFPYLNVYEKFELFLHNSNGWFHVASPSFTGADAKIFKPTNSWAWEGIDAILLAHKYNFEWWWDGGPPPYQYHETVTDSWIDYIGLLTKDPANTTFCTDGSGYYNKIVDDGKRCYWNLNCRERETDGKTGWYYEGPSEGIKPIKDLSFSPIDSCCQKGTCGEGFCSFEIDNKKYCYYGVKCAHGGWWPDGLQECTGGTCTSKGCVYYIY